MLDTRSWILHASGGFARGGNEAVGCLSRGIAQKVAKAGGEVDTRFWILDTRSWPAKAGGEVEGRAWKVEGKDRSERQGNGQWNLQGVECGTPISGRLLLRQVEIGAGAMSPVCHYLEDRREWGRIKLVGEKNRLSLVGMCR